MEAIGRIGHGVFGVSAVERVAGEERIFAEVFLVPAAIEALAAGIAQPRHAEAVADAEFLGALACLDDRTDNLVSRNEGELGVGQFAVDDMQVGPADPARHGPG